MARKPSKQRLAMEARKAEIIRLHKEAGMGTESIVEKLRLGVSGECLRCYLREWGAYKRTTWTPQRAILEEKKEQICALYSQGVGSKRIVKALALPFRYDILNKSLKRWGVFEGNRFSGGYKRGVKITSGLTVIELPLVQSSEARFGKAEQLIAAEYKRELRAAEAPDEAWAEIWRAEQARREAKRKYWEEPERYRDYSRTRYGKLKRDPVFKAQRAAVQKRWDSDPRNRMRNNLGVRLWHALKSKTAKTCSVTELIGCTIPQLRAHLEHQFSRRMGWHNYGSAWHVDHIVPCSYFNLLDVEEQRRCFHYTNLRPLWAKANVRRGDRVGAITPNLLIGMA